MPPGPAPRTLDKSKSSSLSESGSDGAGESGASGPVPSPGLVDEAKLKVNLTIL